MAWLYLVVGIVVFVAPWVLGFASTSAGLWGNIILGLIIVIAAIYELASTK